MYTVLCYIQTTPHMNTIGKKTIALGLICTLTIVLVISNHLRENAPTAPAPAPQTKVQQPEQVIINQLPVGTYTLMAVEFIEFAGTNQTAAKYAYRVKDKNGKEYKAIFGAPVTVQFEALGGTLTVTEPGKIKITISSGKK